MERYLQVLDELNKHNPPITFADCINNIWEAARLHVKEVLDNGDA